MPSPLKITGAKAFHRRLDLVLLTILFVALIALPMFRSLSRDGWSTLKVIFFGLFLIMMAQVAFSTLVAVAGWMLLRRGNDPNRINAEPSQAAEGSKLPATAIVMPIHNEEVTRVFLGLRAMYDSLQRTSHAEAFDFFILSDTTDPNCWIAEEKAWFDLCKSVGGFGRIFYRKRRVQLHHKSGNIADFCRRWGANYRYMIVLDADSVMTGGAFVQLTELMERYPWVGIIQSSPQPVFGQCLFQRIEQFAAAVYRPVFTAGANFWQLGDSTYWGHNAIIRLHPFMEYCAMPELPEVGPLGTRILSHDTIEAALMRRGGFEVWQAYDLEGSFEEMPPNLISSLQRDRRWCHGNLQHIWFLFERELKPVSRYNILNGILAYANSPLWFCSLILGIVVALGQSPDAHSSHSQMPGFWFYWGPLYIGMMALLLLPKFLGISILMRSPEKLKSCGGPKKAIASAVAETFYSILLSPILMLFYTRFVLASFFGGKVGWGPQVRSAGEGPPWSAWIKVHWLHTTLALATAAWLWSMHPTLLLWLTTVLAGPILAIPFSRAIASSRLGRTARRRGWFLTPQETEPLPELAEMARPNPFESSSNEFFRAPEYAADYGLLQAVLDPYINAMHVSLLRQRAERSSRTQGYISMLADRLLMDGPLVLTHAEKRTLLWHAEAMSSMHQKLWSSPASHLHEWWQAAFRHYVESTALSARRTASN